MTEAPRRLLPEDEPVPTPDGFIGQTIESHGVSRRVESILAVGSECVVFNLRNLASGEIDEVLKVHHYHFDPVRPLMEALPEAANDMDRNPDRVIRICNRWLELRPTEEAAAFNKGVAHLAKNELREALKAFDLAVSLAPQDLWNLIYRASCHARMNKDRECLQDFSTATHQNNERLRAYLLDTEPGTVIQRSLNRIARADPSNQGVRQVLRDYFGPLFRVRSALRRLRSRLLRPLRRRGDLPGAPGSRAL